MRRVAQEACERHGLWDLVAQPSYQREDDHGFSEGREAVVRGSAECAQLVLLCTQD